MPPPSGNAHSNPHYTQIRSWVQQDLTNYTRGQQTQRSESKAPHAETAYGALAKRTHGFTWTFTCCEWMPFAITTNS
jgi:hypothetical protein